MGNGTMKLTPSVPAWEAKAGPLVLPSRQGNRRSRGVSVEPGVLLVELVEPDEGLLGPGGLAPRPGRRGGHGLDGAGFDPAAVVGVGG